MSVTGHSRAAARSNRPLQRRRGPGAGVGNRCDPSAGELFDGGEESGGGRAGHRRVVHERKRAPIVAPALLVEGQIGGVPRPRNEAVSGERDRILIDRLAPSGQRPHAGRAQRQRAAERAAQVISLGQLARVEGQQRPCPRKESHIQ